MQNTNLLIIFLTGLTTGGLSCLALQGGLLTSVMANVPSLRGVKRRGNPEGMDRHSSSTCLAARRARFAMTKDNFLPVISFLSAKLFIHTILGLALGFLGASMSLSPITRGWLQIIIGLYLFGVAANLLNLHPIFRYFVITPPKFLAKLAKNESQSNSLFAPAILGLLTVFLPCATTQAMEIVAIGTGNPLYAAAIMFAFVLGTSPTFLIFGFLLQQGSSWFRKYFPAVAATAMFSMSIYSINAGAGLMGSIYTIQNFVEAAKSSPSPFTNSVLGDKVQTATINVTNSGYTPTNINLKRGVLTRLKLITTNVKNCSRSFTIPKLGLQQLLPETGESTIEFTPTTTGSLAFSCSMGMFTGRFNIID